MHALMQSCSFIIRYEVNTASFTFYKTMINCMTNNYFVAIYLTLWWAW